MTMGRLLQRQEHRSGQDRSKLTRSVAFTTARALAKNAERKSIIKEWREREGGGSEEFKKRRDGLIIQSAAELAGSPIGDAGMQKLKEQGVFQKEKKKKAAGAQSEGRTTRTLSGNSASGSSKAPGTSTRRINISQKSGGMRTGNKNSEKGGEVRKR